MIGLGTIINTAAIVIGGLLGYFFGRLLIERIQDTLNMACGVSVLFIGIAGAMEYMLPVSEKSLSGGGTILMILTLTLGGLIGEWIDIEAKFERFGEWLKKKTGNQKDNQFIHGFVTSSLTVCIGAMAIVGSIQDGVSGDYVILAAKSVLDFIIVMVMTCAMGKGCIFSAVPVFLLEGGITLLASLLKPVFTDLALNYISFVGSVLIFCVGLNLVWGKKVRVANLLPAIFLAIAAAYLPVTF